MGVVLDLLFCMIALCFVVSGFKRGLVRSLAELIGYFFAIAASFALSDYLTAAVCGYLNKRQAVTPLDRTFLKVISILVIFIVLQILVQMAARALDAVCRLPGLHAINSLLGGVLGLLKGILVVLVLCVLLRFALPYLSSKFPQIKEGEIRQSRIYKYAETINPVYLLYQAEI
ncbi:CvpA family protein [Caproiciproducens galactitolivorans]|uniref:CvpA family protein n=1 Tax=Caproiciproducens galactitolivorans TaxID=642589 RepID=A0ABT4BV12_9FIRM|nr:CvpA family protein [Caproiciproducens galactitolivorans]MCY1713773.1 CvpA family protein [Caproiciproducens galactitolivorans]